MNAKLEAELHFSERLREESARTKEQVRSSALHCGIPLGAVGVTTHTLCMPAARECCAVLWHATKTGPGSPPQTPRKYERLPLTPSSRISTLCSWRRRWPLLPSWRSRMRRWWRRWSRWSSGRGAPARRMWLHCSAGWTRCVTGIGVGVERCVLVGGSPGRGPCAHERAGPAASTAAR